MMARVAEQPKSALSDQLRSEDGEEPKQEVEEEKKEGEEVKKEGEDEKKEVEGEKTDVEMEKKDVKPSPEALKMLAKYPGRLPVICFKEPGWGLGLDGAAALADLPERKTFLVPSSMTCVGLRDTRRKHIKDSAHVSVAAESIHLKADGTTLFKDATLQDAYDQHKAEDCFLYISFSAPITDTGTGFEPDDAANNFQKLLKESAGDEASSLQSVVPAADEGSLSPQRPGTREVGKVARKLLARHPNNVPVVCEKASGSDAPAITKNRLLLRGKMRCSEFRKTIIFDNILGTIDAAAVLPSSFSLSASGQSLDGATPMQQVYEQHQSDDGFLYLTYDLERPLAAVASTAESPVEAESKLERAVVDQSELTEEVRAAEEQTIHTSPFIYVSILAQGTRLEPKWCCLIMHLLVLTKHTYTQWYKPLALLTVVYGTCSA